MASTRYKDRSRQHYSLPNNIDQPNQQTERQTTHPARRGGGPSHQHLQPAHGEKRAEHREARRQNSVPPSHTSSSTKPKTRTISVPAGLKDILNDLSKEARLDEISSKTVGEGATRQVIDICLVKSRSQNSTLYHSSTSIC